MRKAHYWKTAGASSCPSELIVVDTETYFGKDASVDGGEYHTLRLGCALAYRYEKGKRTRIQRLTFRKPEEFWNLVRSRLSRSRPVWVIGHNLAYDMGVLNGWKLITGDEYKTEKRCISGTMFFVKGTVNGCGLNFLDTINYWHCSLLSIGKSVGLPKMTFPKPEENDYVWEQYCTNDVEVTARGIEAIINFNRFHCLGPFQPTIASAAFAAYRSCFMRDKILVHDTWPVLELERASYFGGICETAFVGRVPRAKVYELDVCSMYPSVCQHDLPVKLLDWSDRMGVKRIQELSERFMLIAEVRLKDTKQPYPWKGKQGTYAPIGEFTTTLAHPELMDAIARGVVRYVNRVSWYTKAPIFKEYMQFFVGHKQAYKEKGDEAFSNVCKLYANSLYGKTGQVTPKWLTWGKDALQIIEQKQGLPEGALEQYYHSPPDGYHWDFCFKYPPMIYPVDTRSDWGDLEIHVGDYESRDSCPAIAACVTSYARVLLRSYQAIAGHGHWFYSDTDSIWCDETGKKRLEDAGCVRPGELGYLDDKGEHSHMHIFGPKDYETDKVIRRKGVRMDAEPSKDGGWTQLQFPGALEQIRDGKVEGVFVRKITKHLHRRITKCVVGEDGYTRPLVFPAENPEAVKRNRRARQS